MIEEENKLNTNEECEEDEGSDDEQEEMSLLNRKRKQILRNRLLKLNNYHIDIILGKIRWRFEKQF